jgi:FkbM family methyltransferase
MLTPSELYFAGASPLAPGAVHRAAPVPPVRHAPSLQLLAPGRRAAGLSHRRYEPPAFVSAGHLSPDGPIHGAAAQAGPWWRSRRSPIVLTSIGGVKPRRDAHGFELQPLHTRLARHLALGANVSFFHPHPNSPCVRRHMGDQPWVVAHVQLGENEFDLAVYDFEGHDVAEEAEHASNEWDEAGFGTVMEYANSFKAKILIDVGASLGWYSFAFATGGRTVLAIEPFGPNLDLFNTSFCLNPARNATIGLMPIGLSSATRRCDLYQRPDGRDYGNAQTVCKSMANHSVDPSLTKQGEEQTYLLDDVLPDEFRTGAKVMRVDVGAHAYHVLRGAATLLVEEGERPLVVSAWRHHQTSGAASPLHAPSPRYVRRSRPSLAMARRPRSSSGSCTTLATR